MRSFYFAQNGRYTFLELVEANGHTLAKGGYEVSKYISGVIGQLFMGWYTLTVCRVGS
jgi:hypothetical protein